MYKRPLFLFLFFYILFLLAVPKEIPSDDIYHNAPYENAVITGRVLPNPQVKPGGVNAFIKVKTLNGVPARGTVYAKLPAGTRVDFMDAVEARGKLSVPFSVSNAGSFDWGKYLADRGVYTQLAAEEAEIKPAPFFFRAVNKVRNDVLDLFDKNFDVESSAVLSGIVLGEKSLVPPELNKAFKDSGAMHLLVASGGNVGFVTLIVYYLCFLLGVKYGWRLPLALAAAGFYTLLAGADPPLTRAYLMTLCAGIGLKTGRNSGAAHGLVMAAVIILLFNPAGVRDVGFQMSFLAAFVIILAVKNFRLPAKWPALIKTPAEIFIITASVQLALLPVYTNIFHRFSFSSFISNIFLVPLAGVLIGAGFLLYFVSLLHIKFLFAAVWGICCALLWIFKFLVNFFGSLPYAAVDAPALTVPSTAIFFICLFLFYNLGFFRYKKNVAAALVLIMSGAVFLNPFKEKNYVYLLNSFGRNAAIINIEGTAFAVSKNFDPAALNNAFSALAVKNPVHVKPFEKIWPGESFESGGVEIKGYWGLNKGHKRFWENTGYSGTKKDGMSFEFIKGNKTIFTGGENDFVKINGEIIFNEKNKTVKANL